jgi:hypothetical protein
MGAQTNESIGLRGALVLLATAITSATIAAFFMTILNGLLR